MLTVTGLFDRTVWYKPERDPDVMKQLVTLRDPALKAHLHSLSLLTFTQSGKNLLQRIKIITTAWSGFIDYKRVSTV